MRLFELRQHFNSAPFACGALIVETDRAVRDAILAVTPSFAEAGYEGAELDELQRRFTAWKEKAWELFDADEIEGHPSNCICADCADAEMSARND